MIGSTVWMCLPPRLTFAFIYPLTMVQLVLYVILNHGPLKKYQIQDDIQYSEVQNDQPLAKARLSSFYYHLNFFYTVLPFACYFFQSSFLYRISGNAIITSLTFPSAPFRIRDHFQYYTYICEIGGFLGAIDIILVSFLCPSWMSRLYFRKIWIINLLSFGHLLFFFCATWYRFVPNVYIVLILCATQGILQVPAK